MNLKKKMRKVNKSVHQFSSQLNKEKLKDELVKIYFACPPKVQFVLAKYVMQAILNKKQRQNEELIRH
jgi:hypothetical protein